MPVDPTPLEGENWTGEEVQGAAPQVVYGTVDGLPFQWRIRRGEEEFRVAAAPEDNPVRVRSSDKVSGSYRRNRYWPSHNPADAYEVDDARGDAEWLLGPGRLERELLQETLQGAVGAYREWLKSRRPGAP